MKKMKKLVHSATNFAPASPNVIPMLQRLPTRDGACKGHNSPSVPHFSMWTQTLLRTQQSISSSFLHVDTDSSEDEANVTIEEVFNEISVRKSNGSSSCNGFMTLDIPESQFSSQTDNSDPSNHNVSCVPSSTQSIVDSDDLLIIDDEICSGSTIIASTSHSMSHSTSTGNSLAENDEINNKLSDNKVALHKQIPQSICCSCAPFGQCCEVHCEETKLKLHNLSRARNFLMQQFQIWLILAVKFCRTPCTKASMKFLKCNQRQIPLTLTQLHQLHSCAFSKRQMPQNICSVTL